MRLEGALDRDGQTWAYRPGIAVAGEPVEQDDDAHPAAHGGEYRVVPSDVPLRVASTVWLLLDADLVLGLDLHRVWDVPDGGDRLPAGATPLLEARAAARGAGDWHRADALREELAAMRVDVIDASEGQAARRARTPRDGT